MKVQAAPELLTRGMGGEKSPNKGDGTGGDKAAAFSALLETGKGKVPARGAQPMAEGGVPEPANKADERAQSDEKALSDEFRVLAETVADVENIDVDAASRESADDAVVIGSEADQAVAGEPDLMVVPSVAATPDTINDAAKKVLDGQVEAPTATVSSEAAAMAVPNDQTPVAVTSMALFFTLTNSLRTAGGNSMEARSTSGKAMGDAMPAQGLKAGLMGTVERLGDLSSVLPSAPTPGSLHTPMRAEAMSVLEGLRAALAPSAGEAASPLVGGTIPSGDNMAALANSLANLTPVTKQIQSALIQQVASGDFASKVDEVMLARNTTNARINNGAIMVTLSPANLGEVTIKLVNRGDVVQIVLQASTDEAAGQIMRDRDTITDLVQTLARKSANVVVQTGVETGDGQTRSQEDGSRRGQSGDEGRPQSDMFSAGGDDRGGRQQDQAPPTHADQSPGGEILI